MLRDVPIIFWLRFDITRARIALPRPAHLSHGRGNTLIASASSPKIAIPKDGCETFVAERRNGGAKRVEKGSLGPIGVQQSKNGYGLNENLDHRVERAIPARAADFSLDDKLPPVFRLPALE